MSQNKVTFAGRAGYMELSNDPFEIIVVRITESGFLVGVSQVFAQLMKTEDVEKAVFVVREALYKERPDLRRQ